MTCRPIFLRKTCACHRMQDLMWKKAWNCDIFRLLGVHHLMGGCTWKTVGLDRWGLESQQSILLMLYLKTLKKQGVGRVCFVSVHLPRSSWWCSKHLMWYCEVLVTICVDHVLRCLGVPHMSLMKQNILSQVELGHLVVETARLTPLCVHSISLLQSCLSSAHRCSTLFHCHLGWETSVSPERLKWFAWWEVGSFSNLFLLQLPQKDLESILFCFRKTIMTVISRLQHVRVSISSATSVLRPPALRLRRLQPGMIVESQATSTRGRNVSKKPLNSSCNHLDSFSKLALPEIRRLEASQGYHTQLAVQGSMGWKTQASIFFLVLRWLPIWEMIFKKPCTTSQLTTKSEWASLSFFTCHPVQLC